MNFKSVAAAAAFATLGSSAFAQAYVGIGLGKSHSCITFDATGTCTDNSTSGKVVAGYALPGTDFAVEGIYSHLGTFKGDSAMGSVDVKVDTFGVGGAWRPQFNADWGGVARAGLEYGRSRATYTDIVPGTPVTTTSVAHAQGYWQPYVGAGLTCAITPKIRLEADLDYTRIKVQRTPVGATSWMLGATFGF